MNDSKTIHFLKEFPAWIVLLAVLLILLAFWIYEDNLENKRFLERVAEADFAGLLLALNVRRTATTQTDINNPTIQTPALNTEQMNDTIVNVNKEENKEQI